MKTENEERVKECRKVKVLVDAKIIVEPYLWGYHTPAEKAKALEREVKEFQDFVRDHRSQDGTKVYVEREYAEKCSNCGTAWETAKGTPDDCPGDDPTKDYCCGCGLEVKP